MMSDQFNLFEYTRPLLRWWWLLVAATLIAAIASFIYSASQPPIYESRATIMVGSSIRDPNPSGGEFYLALQLAETYADIANRGPLHNATMEALGVDWIPYFSVYHVANRPVIQVSVYDENPERAYLVATEIIRQVILLGPQEELVRTDFVDQQLNRLQASITQTEESIITQENQLLGINSARELANKRTEIKALQDKLTTLQSNYANLLATTQRGAVNALKVLEPPLLPTAPIASDLVRNLLVAAIMGFMLAAGGAYLLEFMDRTFRSIDELKQTLNVTILGAIPEITEADDDSGQKLIMLQPRQTSAAEAYRMVRVNLQFAAVDHPLRRILLTSAQSKDGKSLAAANLSIALASAGNKVVLIDCDLHKPTQHHIFKLANYSGVTTALLVDGAQIESLLQPTIVPHLSVLTSGPLPPNAAELLGSNRMRATLDQLQELADVIVIDGPPILAVVDGLVLAPQVDGLVFIIKAGFTNRDAAKRALAALRQSGARILGAIFNCVPTPQMDFYNVDYGYYHAAYGSHRSPTGRGSDSTKQWAAGRSFSPQTSSDKATASVYDLQVKEDRQPRTRETQAAPADSQQTQPMREEHIVSENGGPLPHTNQTSPLAIRRKGLPWK